MNPGRPLRFARFAKEIVYIRKQVCGRTSSDSVIFNTGQHLRLEGEAGVAGPLYTAAAP
jgi:hypothetical protein